MFEKQPNLLSTALSRRLFNVDRIALFCGSGSSGPGSNPGLGHCVVLLGKTLYSSSASLHPGVQMGTGEFNAGSNTAMD